MDQAEKVETNPSNMGYLQGAVIAGRVVTDWYRSKVFAWADEVISQTRFDKGKDWDLFCSDWWEAAVLFC
jgi:hypothetical protein